MSKKIRYPRTTLEICDASLSVLRDGLKMGFSGYYPELTCYNGRRWQDGMNRSSIYYVRTAFAGWQPNTSAFGFDVRMVIVRNCSDALNSGFPFFWCTVWYRRVSVKRASVPPESYEDTVYRSYHHLPRWGRDETDKITDFDPEFHFSDLEMIHKDLPPRPIHFVS